MVSGDKKEKKPLDMRWIGGGLAVVALLLVFAGFKMFGGGDTGADDTQGGASQTARPSGDTAGPVTNTSTPMTSAPVVSGVASAPSGGGQVAVVADVPYNVVAAPNPKLDFGVMGIMPRQATSNARQAAGLAAFARRQFVNVGRWKTMDIYVFDDQSAAQQFADYQSRRSGYPLGPTDYTSLVGVWQHTPARYRYAGQREALASPAAAPDSWWKQTS
jgi:hypothetical protein